MDAYHHTKDYILLHLTMPDVIYILEARNRRVERQNRSESGEKPEKYDPEPHLGAVIQAFGGGGGMGFQRMNQ